MPGGSSILSLSEPPVEFPTAHLEHYDKEYKLPFLYHYYFKSNSNIRKYIHYHKRPLKALELLGITAENNEGRLLDVGCDWGYLLMLAKRANPELSCYGIDIDSYSCKFGNLISAHNNIDIRLTHSNARELPFPDNFFDFVVSTGTFEHILPKWRSQAVSEIGRVLKNKGRLVVLFPNPRGLSQVVKDFLSEKTNIGNYTKWLPNIKEKESNSEIRLSHSDGQEDVYCLTASDSVTDFKSRLYEAGFELKKQDAFIFIVEFLPNFLLKPSIIFEKLMESFNFSRKYCTTLFFSASLIK